MLQNESLLSKIVFDTAENDPCKVSLDVLGFGSRAEAAPDEVRNCVRRRRPGADEVTDLGHRWTGRSLPLSSSISESKRISEFGTFEQIDTVEA